MKLAHQYLRGALADPAVRAAYEEEARRINARTRSVAIANFLTDPVIDGIDDTLFTGAAGCCLLVVTGNEFKVVRISVSVEDAVERVLDWGDAERVLGKVGRVWAYEERNNLTAAQPVTLRVRAYDRPGHCAALTITNRQEFAIGTSPTDSRSSLRLSLTSAGPLNVELQFQAMPDRMLRHRFIVSACSVESPAETRIEHQGKRIQFDGLLLIPDGLIEPTELQLDPPQFWLGGRSRVILTDRPLGLTCAPRGASVDRKSEDAATNC